MEKGISPIISVVLLTLVSISAIYLVLYIAKPIIDRVYETAAVNEANQNLKIFDNLIREVASEGTGSYRTIWLKVSDGSYSVNNVSESFEYEHEVHRDVVQPGTYIKQDNIFTIGATVGGALADQNSTHLILENDVLKVFLQRVGNEINFTNINTSQNIKAIQLKPTGLEICPLDSSIQIGSDINSKWGTGYSKLVKKDRNLPRAEALFHISSSSGIVYDILYTLPGGADFLIINVKNVTGNEATLNFIYHIGSQAYNDTIKIAGAAESYYQSGG